MSTYHRLVGSNSKLIAAVLMVAVLGIFIASIATAGIIYTHSTFYARLIDFNDLLRTDRGPVDGRRAATTFNPPDASRQDIVAPAVPDQMPDARLREMPLADTFWIAPGTVSLSWEVIFGDPLLGGRVPTLSVAQGIPADSGQIATEMTAGPDGLTDPIERRFLIDQGVAISFGSGGNYDRFAFLDGVADVFLRECRAPLAGANPYDVPWLLTQDCIWSHPRFDCDPAAFDSAVTLGPWTVQNCEVVVDRDTSFEVHVRDWLGGDIRSQISPVQHNPRRLSTQFYVIGDTPRLLARPLRFSEEECTRFSESDGELGQCRESEWAALERLRDCLDAMKPRSPEEFERFSSVCAAESIDPYGLGSTFDHGTTRLRSFWNFQVPTWSGSGFLDETFSEDVLIDRIRVFVERNGEREYFQASDVQRIKFGVHECAVETGRNGEALFVLSRCSEIRNEGQPNESRTATRVLANPTWAEPDLQSVLLWELTLRTYNEGSTFQNDLPAREGERPWLEFEMVLK